MATSIKHAAADRDGDVTLTADTVEELRIYGHGTVRLYSAAEVRWVSSGTTDTATPAPTSGYWLVPAGSGDGPAITPKEWARVVRDGAAGYTSIFIWSAGGTTLRYDFR